MMGEKGEERSEKVKSKSPKKEFERTERRLKRRQEETPTPTPPERESNEIEITSKQARGINFKEFDEDSPSFSTGVVKGFDITARKPPSLKIRKFDAGTTLEIPSRTLKEIDIRSFGKPELRKGNEFQDEVPERAGKKIQSLITEWMDKGKTENLIVLYYWGKRYLRKLAGTLFKSNGDEVIESIEKEISQIGLDIEKLNKHVRYIKSLISNTFGEDLKAFTAEKVKKLKKEWMKAVQIYAHQDVSHEIRSPEEFIFPISLATGISREKIKEKFLELGLGAEGYYSSNAYSHPTWNSPKYLSDFFKEISENPESFGLPTAKLEKALEELWEDPMFLAFLDWFGGERPWRTTKRISGHSPLKEIEKFNEKHGEGTFERIFSKLIQTGGLNVTFSPHRSSTGRRSSSPSRYLLKFTEDAKKILDEKQEETKNEPDVKAKLNAVKESKALSGDNLVDRASSIYGYKEDKVREILKEKEESLASEELKSKFEMGEVEKRRREISEKSEGIGVPSGADSEVDFEDIEEKSEWVSFGSPSLTEKRDLVYLKGIEEMGFEPVRGLIRLELLDRGRKPFEARLQASDLDLENKDQLEKISNDQLDYYNLIWIEGGLNSWKSFFEKENTVSAIADEADKSLEKHILKYIVFANSFGKKGKISSKSGSSLEEISRDVSKVDKRLKNTLGPLKEIKLDYCGPDDDRGRKLGYTPLENQKARKGIIKTFLRILQVNEPPFDESEIAWATLDQVWAELWDQRTERGGIERLQDKYSQKKKIRRYLPPSAKQKNESSEHFVMKQLIVNSLLRREWLEDFPELAGRDYEAEWVEKEATNDRKHSEPIQVESWKFRRVSSERGEEKEVIKKPDVVATDTQGNEIWIEAETCKALESPLEKVKEKLRILSEIETYDPPEEIWLVFPYRKYIAYGKEVFEQKFRRFFEGLRKENDLSKLEPRIFFTDFYEEKLLELNPSKQEKV